jgi:predicted HTH domain antitoxin
VILSLSIPDEIAAQLHLGGEGGNRRLLEMFAAEGYRSGDLSRGQVSELLGMELNETMHFLQDHGCTRCTTLEEFEQDSDALRQFLAR